MTAATPRTTNDPTAPVLAHAAASARQLERVLRGIAAARGLAALVVAAWLLAFPTSAPVVARLAAGYWIVDGLLTLWAVRVVHTLTIGRIVLLVRGGIAIVAGLLILGLPLGVVFGGWQLGQGFLFVLVAAVMLGAIGSQIGAAAFDVLIWSAIRRRIPGDWSWMLGAAFSIVVAVTTASIFVAPGVAAGRGAGVAAAVAALAFLVAALPRGGHAASVLPARPPKP